MPFAPETVQNFLAAPFDAVIDVRSPSEYAEDHVPGAISLPVLSDEERARVGTIYVQESPFLARKIGAALVARNAATHIEGPLADLEGGWKPLVYCWRGGQRSGSFASILGQIGWRADTVEGGYRRWRRLVKEALYDRPFPAPVILLDGNTGTAKTDLLARLASRGVQVIDLEGLANHKGSALGSQGPQPAQKAFETALATEMARLDPARPVVVEAESSKIGRLILPPSLFNAMKAAPAIEVTAPVEARAAYLVEDYAGLIEASDGRIDRLDLLRPLQGHEAVDAWQAMAREGRYSDLARELITRHYDPRYAKVRARTTTERMTEVATETLDLDGRERLADRIAAVISGQSG
ncbi:tRNA 2-selenouridine(34) synthase MnmH [Alphaproteobacteria bacterium GH1-50]|uniref:tRNA 2-selenouridine(34) synthase MnmH n=1 Tax=Kangsaoukella pontilimi TaxID=2691042 RepID=A0A7C9MIB4_9RHOB|nr:tRNA 2-selenouridine(34) synthase MnmH [Kangsaoukella pontilimi]MXQ06795.1 tRNA 2-selenouridine(34) synthase MnmH [Kangsaoukella pontilimi]